MRTWATERNGGDGQNRKRGKELAYCQEYLLLRFRMAFGGFIGLHKGGQFLFLTFETGTLLSSFFFFIFFV